MSLKHFILFYFFEETLETIYSVEEKYFLNYLQEYEYLFFSYCSLAIIKDSKRK
jgi:hypothetical protein